MGPVTALGQDSLGRAVRAAGIRARPVWLDEATSTNEVATRLAEEGAPDWTVVAAGHQTAGRGRLGRSWEDAPGRSLLFSVVVRPRLDPSAASLVALAAATAMVEASGVRSIRSKWPNDLVIGERKVGGILTEARIGGGEIEHVVVGIGVNLSQAEADFPPELRRSATSLSAEGIDVDPQALMYRFLEGFRTSLADDPGAVIEAYRAVCATLGRRIRAITAGGEAIQGTAVDLDHRGALLVERGGRREAVAFGEVVHLR